METLLKEKSKTTIKQNVARQKAEKILKTIKN